MKKKQIIIISIIFCILAFVMGAKFIIHEKWQSSQIHEQENLIETLSNRINEKECEISELQNQIDKLNSKVEYSDTAFNYLAIGNSITSHGLADYWWNEGVGMAATEANKDYVHLVADSLKNEYGDICWYSTNFSKWERQAHDRAETYEDIDKYLNKKLDLVTIQLSENASDLTNFESDFEALIEYVRVNAPKAEILVIDDFWNDGDKESMKIEASKNTGVKFVSLDDIKGNPEYQCGIGTVVFDSEGNEHVVEHEGVAGHPGNKGMQFIADRIIEALKQ